jgi:phosphoserine phosphatase RsbU/P
LHNNGSLQIINCGHVPPILTENGAVTRIEEGDMPVGLLPDVEFHLIERQLPPGSRLCVLTDGITESEDDEGAEFGLQRVEQCANAADPIVEMLAAVNAFSGAREAQDDRTIVILERAQ